LISIRGAFSQGCRQQSLFHRFVVVFPFIPPNIPPPNPNGAAGSHGRANPRGRRTEERPLNQELQDDPAALTRLMQYPQPFRVQRVIRAPFPRTHVARHS
jgi:hypothetical protein